MWNTGEPEGLRNAALPQWENMRIGNLNLKVGYQQSLSYEGENIIKMGE
jgi:hypothetical protein